MAHRPGGGAPGDPRPRKFFAKLRGRLIRFAKHELALAAPAGDGHTLRQHLERVRRNTGKTPPQLVRPYCPPLATELWNAFLELDRARGSSGYGPSPIGYGEIEAWARLTGRQPSPQEVQLLVELDRLVLDSHAKPSSAAKPGQGA